MMAVALFISLSYFNYVNAALILLAILSYTLIYTLFLKRTSPFGTVLGGIPGALPVLIGYTAIKPVLHLGRNDSIHIHDALAASPLLGARAEIQKGL